jgi:hypothetical protein
LAHEEQAHDGGEDADQREQQDRPEVLGVVDDAAAVKAPTDGGPGDDDHREVDEPPRDRRQRRLSECLLARRAALGGEVDRHHEPGRIAGGGQGEQLDRVLQLRGPPPWQGFAHRSAQGQREGLKPELRRQERQDEEDRRRVDEGVRQLVEADLGQRQKQERHGGDGQDRDGDGLPRELPQPCDRPLVEPRARVLQVGAPKMSVRRRDLAHARPSVDGGRFSLTVGRDVRQDGHERALRPCPSRPMGVR